MDHLRNALESMVPRINMAVQTAIGDMRLSRTGRLINSVQTKVVYADGGFTLATSLVDYGLILNQRVHFMEKAIDPNTPAIEQEITSALEQDIENKIDELINNS